MQLSRTTRRFAGAAAAIAATATLLIAGSPGAGADTDRDCQRAGRLHDDVHLSGVNGATLQARVFHRHYDRADALRTMLRSYVELMHANEPVHTWLLT